MIAFLSLFFATFVSEDLACISAGVLIGQGAIEPPLGVLACLSGIVAGDIGLWVVGRVFGDAVLAWRSMTDRLPANEIDALGHWLTRHAGAAIVTSRFVPGTRLPLYLVAGFVKLPLRVFAGWTTVGAALWTPAIVLLTAYTGVATNRFLASGSLRWTLSIVSAALLFAAVRRVRSTWSAARARPQYVESGFSRILFRLVESGFSRILQ